jgi:hypothetical protein
MRNTYQVTHEFSGRGLEASCLILVTDQYGTVWQDRILSRDEYDSSREFRQAIRDKIEEYRAAWPSE